MDSSPLFGEVAVAFEGSPIACILYGVYLVIAGMSLALLHKKRYKLLLSYTIVQLVLTTLYLALWLYTSPATILEIFGMFPCSIYVCTPLLIRNFASILNTWISDAFLLYRCHVICMGNKYELAVPALLYLCAVGASVAFLVAESAPSATNSQMVHVTGTCFWSLSAGMNVFASCIISVRLWMHRRAIAEVLGSQRGAFYLSYMAMTLESAFLYTVFGIITAVMFKLSSPLKDVFVPVLGMIQPIAPLLIVYRIARGMSFQTDDDGSIAVGSLCFMSSVVRTVHQDMADNSGTTHVELCDRTRNGGGDINGDV